MSDNTRTAQARTLSRESRHDKATRQAQARLADLSFSQFMREHNARIEKKG